MSLRRPTEIRRATVDQQARVIVPAENPVGGRVGTRRVTLITPSSPTVSIGFDVTPEEVGVNRTYKLMQCASGFPMKFRLQPQQTVVASAVVGQAFVSVLIEYED